MGATMPELGKEAGVLGNFILVSNLEGKLVVDDLHVDEDCVVRRRCNEVWLEDGAVRSSDLGFLSHGSPRWLRDVERYLAMPLWR